MKTESAAPLRGAGPCWPGGAQLGGLLGELSEAPSGRDGCHCLGTLSDSLTLHGPAHQKKRFDFVGYWGATRGTDQGHGAVAGWRWAWEDVNLTDVQGGQGRRREVRTVTSSSTKGHKGSACARNGRLVTTRGSKNTGYRHEKYVRSPQHPYSLSRMVVAFADEGAKPTNGSPLGII